MTIVHPKTAPSAATASIIQSSRATTMEGATARVLGRAHVRTRSTFGLLVTAFFTQGQGPRLTLGVTASRAPITTCTLKQTPSATAASVRASAPSATCGSSCGRLLVQLTRTPSWEVLLPDTVALRLR